MTARRAWGGDLSTGERGFQFGTLLGYLCVLQLELLAVEEFAPGGSGGGRGS